MRFKPKHGAIFLFAGAASCAYFALTDDDLTMIAMDVFTGLWCLAYGVQLWRRKN